jgi:hypothetical protein
MKTDLDIREISSVRKQDSQIARYRAPTPPKVIKPRALRPGKVIHLVKNGVAQKFDFYVVLAAALVIFTQGCATVKEATKNYDFYAFGVKAETFKPKNMNYFAVAAGVVTAIAVHEGGHYLYAGLNHMSVRQNGFYEVAAYGYSAQQYREFASAGHIAQAVGGLILTSIPYTRQTSFTKGYVVAELLETTLYSQAFRHDGDLVMSRQYGGSGWEEYGYDVIAVHNVLRIKW